MKTKVVCRKNNQIHFPMGKGLSVKIYIVLNNNSAGNTANVPTFISPICLHKPKGLGYH